MALPLPRSMAAMTSLIPAHPFPGGKDHRRLPEAAVRFPAVCHLPAASTSRRKLGMHPFLYRKFGAEHLDRHFPAGFGHQPRSRFFETEDCRFAALLGHCHCDGGKLISHFYNKAGAIFQPEAASAFFCLQDGWDCVRLQKNTLFPGGSFYAYSVSSGKPDLPPEKFLLQLPDENSSRRKLRDSSISAPL